MNVQKTDGSQRATTSKPEQASDPMTGSIRSTIREQLQRGSKQSELLKQKLLSSREPSKAVHPVPEHDSLSSKKTLLLERAATDISNSYNLSTVTSRLLASRGFSPGSDLDEFLKPRLTKFTKRASSMLGLKEVRSEIARAIVDKTPVTIACDYDADGTTSAAILKRFLRDVGIRASVLSPDRNTEGHGLNQRLVAEAAKKGGLLIALDFGTKSPEELSVAREYGLKTVVIDHHHQPDDTQIEVDGFINPRRTGCGFGNEDLCTAGLTWLVTHAVRQHLLRSKNSELSAMAKRSSVKPLLALAALGTIADVVELTPCNRAIVAAGLREMDHTPIKGLRELKLLCGIDKPIQAEDLGFGIAPRLNAISRMTARQKGGKTAGMLMVDLLSTQTTHKSRELAELADDKNRQRKELQKLVTSNVIKKLEATKKLPPVIFVTEQEFKGSIQGIIASKLVDRYSRPAFVMRADGDGTYVGSARGVSGLHLAEVIDECRDLVERGGGHAGAAGFSVLEANLPKFKKKVTNIIERNLKGKAPLPVIKSDIVVSLAELKQAGPALFKELHRIEPFGRGNVAPRFYLEKLSVASVQRIDHRHMKLWLREGKEYAFGIIWNHRRHPAVSVGASIDVVARPVLETRNAIHNRERQALQLDLLAVKPSIRS